MIRVEKNVKVIAIILFHIFIVSAASSIYAEGEKDLLDMTLEELMNVKITTAARTPEKIGDIPASVVLITRKNIETYGYRTLAEILENIPGLYQINDYGEEGVNFGVRGFWSGVPNDNMIIMVNGVTQVSDFQSNYSLNKVNTPVEAIDRIEIIRGPMSVIYGNGAFYGVINIFTNDFLKDDEENRPKGKSTNIVSSSFGSEKAKKIFIRASGQHGEFDYSFNASLYDTLGIDQPISKMVRDTGILPFYGVPEDHRTGGRLENNEKYFNFSGRYKGFFLDISYNETDAEFSYVMPSFSDGNKLLNNSTNISFRYNKKLSDKFTIDGKFSYFQTRTWERFDYLFENFEGTQQYESNAWESEVNAFIYPAKGLDIQTGFYYRGIQAASTIYDIPSFGAPSLINNYLYLSDNNDIVTRAFFTQVNYRPFSKLTLVGGIRLEQMPEYGLEAILAGGTSSFRKVKGIYKQDEIEIIPRFAAIYSLNDKHFFKLLYGQAINRPSFFQNTQNILLNPKQGEGFLSPESIETLELNYIASFSANFTLNLSIFRNTLENLITRVSELDNISKEYQTWSANAGTMVTQGAELTLNAEPLKNFRLELSATFQETDDKRPGYENIEVAYSPKLLGYMKVSYRSSNFALAITGNYVGAMETFWDETRTDEFHPFGQRIGDRVDGYFLLGTNLRFENLFKIGIYINIRCSNLLDEEIRYPTFTNNEWATRGTIGIGRTFLVSLGWKF